MVNVAGAMALPVRVAGAVPPVAALTRRVAILLGFGVAGAKRTLTLQVAFAARIIPMQPSVVIAKSAALAPLRVAAASAVVGVWPVLVTVNDDGAVCMPVRMAPKS